VTKEEPAEKVEEQTKESPKKEEKKSRFGSKN